MVEQRSSTPSAWVRFLLSLCITIINVVSSDKTITPQLKTKSSSEGLRKPNFHKQRRPSFLHPNRTTRPFEYSRHDRFSLNSHITKPLIPRRPQNTDLVSRKLKKTRLAQRLPFLRRTRFRRKPVKTLMASYFRNQLRRPQSLLKRHPYRDTYSGPKSGIFFRMFPVRDQPTVPTVAHFGLENSFFWFYGAYATQFSPKTWTFHELFFSATSLSFPIGKAPIRDLRSFKTKFSPNYALPFLDHLGVSVTVAAKPWDWESRNSVPSTYTLWLTRTSQPHDCGTVFFLRNFLTFQSTTSLRARSSLWTTHSRKTNWLRYKSTLLRHNVMLKKTVRRIFSFYSYTVSAHFAQGGESKRFIPELPLALRGSFWSETNGTVRLAIADLWQNETLHELSRPAPSRIPEAFRLNRVASPQNIRAIGRPSSSSFPNIFLDKLTHRNFKNAFYSKPVSPVVTSYPSEIASLTYSTRKRLTLPLNNSTPSLNSRGVKHPLTIYKTRQLLRKRSKRRSSGSSALAYKLNSLNSRARTLFEDTNPAEKSTQNRASLPVLRPLAPRLNTKLRRNTRRRLRILKSRNRRKVRRAHWGRRLLTRIRSRLRRNPPRRLRASKARKSVWRRSQKFLHTSLNLSKRPSKPKNYRHRNYKTRDNKTFYRTYRATVKQFNLAYSKSYSPVIGSLVLNEILCRDLSSPADRIHSLTGESSALFPRVRTKVDLSSALASANSHLPTLLTIWTSPTLLKYTLLNPSFNENNSRLFENNCLSNFAVGAVTRRLQNQLAVHFFGSQSTNLRKLNIWNIQCANYVLRKRLLRVSSNSLFLPDVTMWYYRTLVRFIENCTGRRVALHFGPFAEGALTFEDRAQVSIWSGRVIGFQRMLGHKIFAQEALMLITVAIRLKDPTFLANWIRGMLKRLSFWKYRLIFRYIKYVIRHLFKSNFDHFQFKGFKLRLKGKISVAGNARTRTLALRVGDTSHSKMDNRVAYDLSYVGTFTGVLGFKLWFFY